MSKRHAPDASYGVQRLVTPLWCSGRLELYLMCIWLLCEEEEVEVLYNAMIKWPWVRPRARQMAIYQQPYKWQMECTLPASLALFCIIGWRIPVVQGIIVRLQVLH